MKLAGFFARLCYQWVAALYHRYQTYLLHGILLPASSEVTKLGSVIIGAEFAVGAHCKICCHDPENGSHIVIGSRVSLNDNVMINADCGGRIVIGNDVLIGPNVVLRASNHKFNRTDAPINTQGHEAGVITIADDVWIGANAVVLPNASIGQGAIIGAGSIVTRNVDPYSIVAGAPARKIGSRIAPR